jgi:hypothetical protein
VPSFILSRSPDEGKARMKGPKCSSTESRKFEKRASSCYSSAVSHSKNRGEIDVLHPRHGREVVCNLSAARTTTPATDHPLGIHSRGCGGRGPSRLRARDFALVDMSGVPLPDTPSQDGINTRLVHHGTMNLRTSQRRVPGHADQRSDLMVDRQARPPESPWTRATCCTAIGSL